MIAVDRVDFIMIMEKGQLLGDDQGEGMEYWYEVEIAGELEPARRGRDPWPASALGTLGAPESTSESSQCSPQVPMSRQTLEPTQRPADRCKQ